MRNGTKRNFIPQDAHGRLQLSPVASYEGRVAARDFLKDDTEWVGYDSIPVEGLCDCGRTDGAREGFC